MIPQKFNVCSCHFAFCAESIYRGAVGSEMRVAKVVVAPLHYIGLPSLL